MDHMGRADGERISRRIGRPPSDYIENECRLEHGKRILTDNAKVDSRDVTLDFTITGTSRTDYQTKKNAFRTELQKGAVSVKVPDLNNEVYHLVYTGKGISYGLSLDRCFGHFSSKFTEPNPMDRE